MAGDPEMQALNRTMKEISRNISDLNRAIGALNLNFVEMVKRLTPPEIILEENTRVFERESEIPLDG